MHSVAGQGQLATVPGFQHQLLGVQLGQFTGQFVAIDQADPAVLPPLAGRFFPDEGDAGDLGQVDPQVRLDVGVLPHQAFVGVEADELAGEHVAVEQIDGLHVAPLAQGHEAHRCVRHWPAADDAHGAFVLLERLDHFLLDELVGQLFLDLLLQRGSPDEVGIGNRFRGRGRHGGGCGQHANGHEEGQLLHAPHCQKNAGFVKPAGGIFGYFGGGRTFFNSRFCSLGTMIDAQ